MGNARYAICVKGELDNRAYATRVSQAWAGGGVW